jgi:hypothetical protein
MSPADWINVSGPDWPSSEIEAAAKLGELVVSRVGHTLLVQRAELDRWLTTKRITKPARGGRLATGSAEWIPSRRGGGRYVAKVTMANGVRVRVDIKDEAGNDLILDRVHDKRRAQRYTRRIADKMRDQVNPEDAYPLPPTDVSRIR